MTFAELRKLKSDYRRAVIALRKAERHGVLTVSSGDVSMSTVDRERREVARLEALMREVR